MNVDNHVVSRWTNKGLKTVNRKLKKKRIRYVKVDVLLSFLEDNKNLWNATKIEEYALGIEPEWLKEKRKTDLLRPKNEFKKWNKHEESILLTNLFRLSLEDIGKMLGRSAGAVERKIKRIKERKYE